MSFGPGSRARITVALVGLVALVLVGWFVREQAAGGPGAPVGPPASAGPAGPAGPIVAGASSGLRVTALSALPPEAAATWRLVRQGGPFPYPRNDGVVYNNREKMLPAKGSGYYHEYTVRTPGSADRGARRLITGAGHELYYTDDHYQSFVLVDPGR